MIERLNALITAASNDIYSCFDHLGLDCGPQDGGCRAYALALLNILPAYFEGLAGEVVFCGRPAVLDHVVLKLTWDQDVYLVDSDGAYCASDMKEKVARDIHSTCHVEIMPYSEELADEACIWDYPELGAVPALLRVLETHALRIVPAFEPSPDFF